MHKKNIKQIAHSMTASKHDSHKIKIVLWKTKLANDVSKLFFLYKKGILILNIT